jgi:hypothetical protein
MAELLFGLGIPAAAAPGADPVGAARAAEALGFDFVGTNDHLHGSSPSFETWTLLTWIAAATSRIRVATRVLATPMRPPPVVAKMAEQIPAMRDRVLGAARDAGRDPAEITCAYNLAVHVDEHAEPRPATVTGPPTRSPSSSSASSSWGSRR